MTIAVVRSCTPARLRAQDVGRDIGAAAVRALYYELALHPKPGLVSLSDAGSHRDMDARTFMRSLFALRRYFCDIAQAGAEGQPLEELRQIGLAAERRMFAATGGVNTHRGAIFSLGLLAAAAGLLYASRMGITARELRKLVRQRWGGEILASRADRSHGAEVAQRYGAGGARLEAAHGFPTVFAIALPAYRSALESTGDAQAAGVQCLFALMAELEDTNLLYRGGTAGLQFARARARDFLGRGGVARPGWRDRALAIHSEFVSRELSPGGAADLLAATLFVHELVRQ